MGKYIELTSANLDETINEGVSLVDFWAPWCGPCRMIAPVIDELANDYEGKANICKVNTDENEDLGAKYQVRSIPTLFIIKDGKVVDTINGGVSKSVLTEALDRAINS
jgi:thioredoxin 1